MLKKELNQKVELIYSDQAVMIIESLKDFDYEKFEADFFKQIIVGDQTIWRYLIEQKLKEKEGTK